MAARSQGVVRMMTRKSELEKSGVWQTRKEKKKKKKRERRAGAWQASKKKKNLLIYTHIRIKRYIQVGTVGRRPGV